MLGVKNVKNFYDIIINRNNYDLGEEEFIYIDLDNNKLYHNLSTGAFIYICDESICILTKEDVLSKLNIILRKDKINKIKNTIQRMDS
jgi:hypothetical protein